MIAAAPPDPALTHAALAGLWVSAGSERGGHLPGSERCHFPVAGTLWIERGPPPAALAARPYALAGTTLAVAQAPGSEELSVWIEAGFLILRGPDEHETWYRKVSHGNP
jgi:hypothetical protein